MNTGSGIAPAVEIPWWAKMRWVLAALLVLGALGYLFLFFTRKLVYSGNLTVLLRHTTAGWVRVARPLGTAERVRVTRGGTVWVQTAFKPGLNRLEGNSWKRYSGSDFGTRTDYLSVWFKLDGEEVWSATPEGVVHFDGRNWKCWRNALAGKDASSIAVGGGEAWVIDETGNLSHHARGAWSISKPALPQMPTGDKATQWYPALARTANGSLWLVRGGIWRFDGSGWAPVANPERPLKKPVLLGVAGDRVWLSEGRDVFSVSQDGRSWARYPMSDMGLPADAWVKGVNGDGPVWFATSAGLAALEGTRWRLIAPPPGVTLTSVAAAPDGTVWATGGDRQPRMMAILRIGYWIAIVGMLATVAWPLRAMRYQLRLHREQMWTAVGHATGQLPGDLVAPAEDRRKGWAEHILALALALAAVFALGRVWPQGVGSSVVTVFIAYEFFSGVLRAIQRREVKPSDPIGPGGPPKYDLAKSVQPVLLAIALFAFMRFDWLLGRLRGWWGLLLILPVGLFVGFILCGWLTDRTVARADYDGALRLGRFLFWLRAGALYVRGDVLLKAGRYAEAEAALRQGIDAERRPEGRSLMLEDLGEALMETGRYGEAQRCFEGARELMPKRSVADRCMAELLLRQGLDAEKALELADRSLKLYRRSGHERVGSRERIGEILATRAWALVLRARSAEALEAIAEALKGPARKSRPALAHVRYNAGMAMKALGNCSAANEHFGRGRDVDPTGRWGNLCAQALRERSA